MSSSAVPFVHVNEQGGSPVPANLIPGVQEQTGLGQVETARKAKYRQMQIEAMDKGWQPASVISFHPFTTTAQGVLLHEPRIAGVPLEAQFWDAAPKIKVGGGIEIPFTQFVIPLPEFTVLEQVVGMETDASGSIDSKTWWPIELANDIVKQNNNMRTRGGMFAYKGSHAPMKGSPRHVDEQNVFNVTVPCFCNDCVQEMADQAYSDAINFYTNTFMEAEEAMASGDPKARQRVKPMHRWVTRYLRKVGVLKEDPKWLTEILTPAKTAPSFCVCGIETPREALMCVKCNYILKPFEAYKQGVIEIDTPGALTALRRCTKDQLKELELYPEVKPLDEYRADQAKERKKETKK